MAYETIDLQVRDGIAHLMLNRPAAANSITLELARDLMEATLACDEDSAVRAVLFTGAGRMFCGGGDLKTFAGKGADLPHYLKEVTTYLHAAMSRLTRMNAPVIAAVQGSAAGAGLSFVCAADIVLAADNAKFTMAYTRAGLTPDGSSTYFLSRIVGLRRALELALTSRVFSAAEAHTLGIVTHVVAEAQLQTRPRRWRRRSPPGRRPHWAPPSVSCMRAGPARSRPRWSSRPGPSPTSPAPTMHKKASRRSLPSARRHFAARRDGSGLSAACRPRTRYPAGACRRRTAARRARRSRRRSSSA